MTPLEYVDPTALDTNARVRALEEHRTADSIKLAVLEEQMDKIEWLLKLGVTIMGGQGCLVITAVIIWAIRQGAGK